MAIERVYYCESPDCNGGSLDGDKSPGHCRTASPPPYLPAGFIEVRLRDDGRGRAAPLLRLGLFDEVRGGTTVADDHSVGGRARRRGFR